MITIRVASCGLCSARATATLPPSECPTTVAPTTCSFASASATALAWFSIE